MFGFHSGALAVEAAAREFGEDVEEAGVVFGVGGEGVFERSRVEVAEDVKDLGDGDLEGGFVDFAELVQGDEVESKVLAGFHVKKAVLLLEPILVAAGFPISDIILVDVLPFFAKFADNVGIRDAVIE